MSDYIEQVTFPSHDKLPAGPWTDEPDKLVWVDETTGLDCMIHRAAVGALCGYVGVGPEHPWHGIDYGSCTTKCGGPWCEHAPSSVVDVHGGLTYAAACMKRRDDGSGICHIAQPGRPADVWWFGFDCAHVGDLVPGSTPLDRVFLEEHGEDREQYRDVEYVKGEIASLARQLAAVAS